MPVTIKLSRTLSDRLGEEVAQELVEWFNQMDAASTRTIRELNELNFARFDSKLEQHIAGLRLRIEALETQLGHLSTGKLGRQEFHQAIDALWARIDSRFAMHDSAIDTRFAIHDSAVDRRLTKAAQWFAGAWVAQMAVLVGAMWLFR